MEYRIRRQPTTYDVTLTTRAGRVSATVTNVHPYGARIKFDPGELDLFSTVVIDFHGVSHAANVMWVHRHEIGVRFTKPLPVETVAMIARKIGGASRERLVRDLATVRAPNQIHTELLEQIDVI
ncbi:MAG: PilZ domain-containing protein [Pseudomonadota bacterium]